MSVQAQPEVSADDLAVFAIIQAIRPIMPEIPFLATTEDGNQIVSFWSVEPSGFEDLDSARGQRYAEIALDLSKTAPGRDPACRGFVGLVLAEIIERGRLGPMEVGFSVRVLKAALAGVQN